MNLKLSMDYNSNNCFSTTFSSVIYAKHVWKQSMVIILAALLPGMHANAIRIIDSGD